MAHLANRMRSLAANGNPRAEELIEKADELDKMIDADTWERSRSSAHGCGRRICGVRSQANRCSDSYSGVFVGRHDGKRRKLKAVHRQHSWDN